MDPRKSWKLQELSKEANVSIGQVANVKRVLKDREWIKEDRNGLWLSAPEKLLADWAQNYSHQQKGAILSLKNSMILTGLVRIRLYGKGGR